MRHERDFDLGLYHEATKHSPLSVGLSRHRLDWSIKPLPFKIYRDLQAIETPPDIERLCLLSNGVLRWRRDGHGESYGFRAAPCTGALYHIELYLAAAARPGPARWPLATSGRTTAACAACARATCGACSPPPRATSSPSGRRRSSSW